MKAGVVFTTLFLISLTGSALAQTAATATAVHTRVGPGPEMSAGILGMTLAVGVLYLIKRRNRHLI
jgi:hypothetical protein